MIGGKFSAAELEFFEMQRVWSGLDAVRSEERQMTEFILSRLSKDSKFDVAGMNEALRLARQFTCSHRVPKVHELVEANQAGRLAEKIAELNSEFRLG